MKTASPILTAILIIFAIIGALAVLAFIGMIFMHNSMMGMMGASSEVTAACQSMMPAWL
jgi:hypothetical protein